MDTRAEVTEAKFPRKAKSPFIRRSLSSNMSSLNVTSEEMAATTKDKIASTMFDIELDFDQWAVEEWVSHNWAWLCLVIGVAYVFLVFLGSDEGISSENMKKSNLPRKGSDGRSPRV